MTDCANKAGRTYRNRRNVFNKSVKRLLEICTECSNVRQLTAAKDTALQSFDSFNSAARVYSILIAKGNTAEINRVNRSVNDAENQIAAAKLAYEDRLQDIKYLENGVGMDDAHARVSADEVDAVMANMLDSLRGETTTEHNPFKSKALNIQNQMQTTALTIQNKLSLLDDRLETKFNNLSLIVDLNDRFPSSMFNSSLSPDKDDGDPDEDMTEIKADIDELTKYIVTIRSEFKKNIQGMKNNLHQGISVK